MNSQFLRILACPICYGKLVFRRNTWELVCKIDNLAFPINNGVPILLENMSYHIS